MRVRRWPVLRDASGAVRGYLPYASFDVPLLLRLLLARRPGAVLVEPPPTTGAVVRVVGALRRVPYAYYAADLLAPAAAAAGAPPPVLAVLSAVEGWALRGAAAVLTVSPGVAALVVAAGVPAERVTVVGTGVDTHALRPDAATGGDPGGGLDSDSGASDTRGGPLLVYAGTMSEVHGAAVFVEAFARVTPDVPGARLLMLGGGVHRAALQQLAARLAPGRVELPGSVPPAAVARAMRRASAGLASVRPGSGYEFAYATKAFAALACGAPVVYAGPGPVADLVVEHRLGWAVPWSADDVEAALRAALAAPPSPAERRRLAAWAQEHASLGAVAERVADAVLALVPASA